ncbi:MAG: TVP38/TMEM64 family protein [Pseudolabrys sp.]|nr:TVP38/TMEM64 family protein [Pseudolabrys sp.]
MAHPRRWFLALIVLLGIANGAAVLWAFDGVITAQSLEAWVAGLGVWVPVGFVLLYGIATIVMVPGSIFDLTGGALFGPYLGSLLNLAGGTLGAALAFLVGRYIARDWVEVRAGPRTHKIMHSVDQEGWRFVAFVRLVPIFPYNVMNYLLGFTRIPFHHYILATVVFMAPSTIVYTWIGHAGRQAIAGDTDNIYYALIALGLLVVMIFLPNFYKRLRRT